MLLTRMSRKVFRLLKFIENPKLFRLRQIGVPIDDFCLLNQPWLTEGNINTVFDIGANVGQFASLIHEVLSTVTIYSFEPLEDCYEKLKKKMQEVNNFRAFNLALGNTNGQLTMHRSEHLPSSSMLPMSNLHKQNYPHATKYRTLEVRCARLDDISKDLKIENNLLIKIDVQGFEDKVIAGGKNVIKCAKIIIIETSFQPLYIGQPLFEDIYDSLKTDFRYMGALGNIRKNKLDGSPLFQDSIFVSKSSNVPS